MTVVVKEWTGCGYGGLMICSMAVLMLGYTGLGLVDVKMPFSQAWEEISKLPQTYDLVLGYFFVAVYLVARGCYYRQLPKNLLLIAAICVFGHVVTMLYVMSLVMKAGSLFEALFTLFPKPQSHPARGAQKRRNPVTWMLAITALLCASYLCVIAINAYREQTFAERWAAVKASPWLMAIFMNNVVGIMFAVQYMMASEMGRWYLIPLVLMCCVGGNGGTMLYLADKMLNDVGSGPIEALLTQNVPAEESP